MIFILITQSISEYQPPFIIETNNEAVVKETLFDAHLYRRTWTVIHVIELNELIKEGTLIEEKLQQLKNICVKDSENKLIYEKSNCTKKTGIDLLQKRFLSTVNLQDSLFNFHLRKKRGLLNMVGEVNKILWGNLANSDLEYINQEIDKLYSNTKEAILLEEKSIQITQNTLKALSTDFEIFNKNFLKIDNWTSTVDSKIDMLTIDDLVTEALFEIEIAIDDYREYIKACIDGISYAHTGHLSPLIMPPDVVINSLQNIQNLDLYVKPTFAINKKNYPLIMKIGETVVYLNNTRLVAVLKVPIAEHEIFAATKFIPLPQNVGHKSYRLFRLPDILIFISKDKTQYAIEKNYEKHCSQGFNIRYCKLNANILKIDKENNCETDLIKNELNNCDAQYFQLTNDYYISLNNGYQWYIAPLIESNYQVICSMDKVIKSFSITENSLLTLRGDCIAKNSKTTLIAANHINYTTIEFPRIININIPEIPHEKLPRIDLQLINTNPLHKEGLNLNEISNELDRFKRDQRTTHWYNTGIYYLNIIGYICIAIVVLFSIYMFKRK